MSNTLTDQQKQQKSQEIQYYQKIIQKMPKFTSFRINAHLRLGKLYAELGEMASAIQHYSAAATQYIHNGALVKAIAANKMVLEIAPEGKDVLADVSALYFKQTDIEDLIEINLEQQLARVPLFSYLAVEERQKITEFLSPVSLEKGQTIIREGDIGDCMYLIQSGEVEVYTLLMETEQGQAPEQESLHLATLKSGDFFGEQALLTNEPRNATIVALTDVSLLRFSKPDLAAVVRSYPRVGELLEKYHHERDHATIISLKTALQNIKGYNTITS